MPAKRAREVFELMARGQRPWSPLPARLDGTYRFDLGDAGSFHVRVEAGRAVVRESRDDAACVLTMSEADLIDLAEGRKNLITCYLQGRVRVQGSLLLAEALHSFLRQTEHRRQEDAAEVRP